MLLSVNIAMRELYMNGRFHEKHTSHFIKLQIFRLEDRRARFAFIDETYPNWAGKQAESPTCWGFSGALAQSGKWLTGKDFEVEEVECWAMSALACV